MGTLRFSHHSDPFNNGRHESLGKGKRMPAEKIVKLVKELNSLLQEMRALNKNFDLPAADTVNKQEDLKPTIANLDLVINELTLIQNDVENLKRNGKTI